MYLIEKAEGAQIPAKLKEMEVFGVKIGAELAQQVRRIEWHGTSFKDPGPDRCEARLFGAKGLISTINVPGY